MRRHLLHVELRGNHHQRQYLDLPVLRLRKVRHPQPRRMPHLRAHREHLIECEEKRHLQEHRQAAPHRVHAVLLVQRHHFFVLLALARVADPHVLVLHVDGVDLRLQRRHLPHRLHVAQLQREQRHVDGHRHQHNRPTEVVDHRVVDVVHHHEQRLGQKRHEPEIHHLLQLWVDPLQQVDILGPKEHLEAVRRSVAQRHAA